MGLVYLIVAIVVFLIISSIIDHYLFEPHRKIRELKNKLAEAEDSKIQAWFLVAEMKGELKSQINKNEVKKIPLSERNLPPETINQFCQRVIEVAKKNKKSI